MIRFLPSPRRLLALAGAVAVGVAAAVAFASPASAHFTAVSGKFSCDTSTGEWVVSWTVTSHNTPAEATMFKLAGIVIGPAGSTITWATPPDQLQSINTPFTGTQRLPGSATSAKLAVRGSWNNGHVEDTFNTAVVTLTGTCAAPAPKPAATFAAACDRSVTVTLANSADATGPARFTVTGEH
ncbi:MAG TPA: cell wall anchor protein, partial [Micromonosporaceae bacterium]|nr:cell wall anchor protein [Micromonosporaceae bacterium]